MTELLKWMAESPFLTFFLACVLAGVAKYALHEMVWLITQPMRVMNIRKHGWPPEHLDADGDYKKPKPTTPATAKD